MSRDAVDLEQGVDDRRRAHRSRSISGSDVSDDDDGEGSCYSQFFSTTGGSCDEYGSGSFVVVSDESRRASSASGCSPARGGGTKNDNDTNSCESDNENVVCVIKAKAERDCRICHLGLESNSHESGAPIELGCSCKGDLGSAHKNCAEAWFKIKGNKTCEICQSIARNVMGVSEIELVEQANEANSATAAAISASESRTFWHGHRFLNFLLACMVFAFVVSWLFHFNMSS